MLDEENVSRILYTSNPIKKKIRFISYSNGFDKSVLDQRMSQYKQRRIINNRVKSRNLYFSNIYDRIRVRRVNGAPITYNQTGYLNNIY